MLARARRHVGACVCTHTRVRLRVVSTTVAQSRPRRTLTRGARARTHAHTYRETMSGNSSLSTTPRKNLIHILLHTHRHPPTHQRTRAHTHREMESGKSSLSTTPRTNRIQSGRRSGESFSISTFLEYLPPKCVRVCMCECMRAFVYVCENF